MAKKAFVLPSTDSAQVSNIVLLTVMTESNNNIHDVITHIVLK